MEEIKQYKTSHLVLQVNENYNPEKLPLEQWELLRMLVMTRKNKYYNRPRISENKFREIIKCFSLDLTAD